MTENNLNKLNHVGIILDGNRRFARRFKWNPWKGHEKGAENVEKLLDWIQKTKIKELTLYCFSIDNFNRDKDEVNFLMKIFKTYFKKLKKEKQIHEKKVKINFIGKRELFDSELQEIMKELEKATKDYNNYKLNFAMGYGGRQEIIEAVKKMVENNEEISEENLQKNLWLSNIPELIIRTSGEKRLSNFLTWQSVYSEWIFSDKLWPEFTERDLLDCIEEFYNRKRRFGK
tara:strand:- start:3242 stop:3931 length:690 start_codon:yes stop_codon:yes gene_type:complete